MHHNCAHISAHTRRATVAYAYGFTNTTDTATDATDATDATVAAASVGEKLLKSALGILKKTNDPGAEGACEL